MIERGAFAGVHPARIVGSAVELCNLRKIVIIVTFHFGDGVQCNLQCATRGKDSATDAQDLVSIRRFICLGLSATRNTHIHENSFGVAWALPRLISALL